MVLTYISLYFQLVELKAELIRKQQEFKKEKVTGGAKSALLTAKRKTHKVNNYKLTYTDLQVLVIAFIQFTLYCC